MLRGFFLIGSTWFVILGAVVQTRVHTSPSTTRLDNQSVGDCTNAGECLRVGVCVAAIGLIVLLVVADFGAMELLTALGSPVTDALSRLLYGIGWPR